MSIHSAQNQLTTNAFYRGLPGWQGRGIATAAVDIKWPLIGAAFGGTQVFTPRVQLVASPHIRNLAIPNEDSRSVELRIPTSSRSTDSPATTASRTAFASLMVRIGS
jgi:hypothetical protein